MDSSTHNAAVLIALIFSILSTLLTLHQVRQHLRYNSHRRIKTLVIRIQLMVPVYAWQSYLSLRYPDGAIYYDLIRDTYEAFVIYTFFSLLVTFLGGEASIAQMLARRDTQSQPHMFPFCCLKPWSYSDSVGLEAVKAIEDQATIIAIQQQQQQQQQHYQAPQSLSPHVSAQSGGAGDFSSYSSATAAAPALGKGSNRLTVDSIHQSSVGVPILPSASVMRERQASMHELESAPLLHSDFLLYSQLGTLQYVVVKSLCAVIAFILQSTGSFIDESSTAVVDFTTGWFYITMMTNFSQILAFYSLVLFYLTLKNELAPMQPFSKFACVKAVVFATFWQSVLISLLARLGVLQGTTNFTEGQIMVAMQDFLITIEMFAASIAHVVAFRVNDFDQAKHCPGDADKHAALLTQDGQRIGQPMFASLRAVVDVSDYVEDANSIQTRLAEKQQLRDRAAMQKAMAESLLRYDDQSRSGTEQDQQQQQQINPSPRRNKPKVNQYEFEQQTNR